MKKYKKVDTLLELYQGKTVCCTCAHFVQHYRFAEESSSFLDINCGHCIFPRIKNRKPDQSCEHWRDMNGRPAGES